jgi:hypothetical protein
MVRSNLRDVLAGICCAAVMMCCGMEVCGVGEDKLYERVTKENVNIAREILKEAIPLSSGFFHFDAIVSDFQDFLGDPKISGNLTLWPSMLILLSPEVSCLLHDERYKTTQAGTFSTLILATNSFGDFVKFCESKYCDATSRSIIYDYLNYIYQLLGNLDYSQHRDQVMINFKNMLDNITPQSKPIISIADGLVFYPIADLLSPLFEY